LLILAYNKKIKFMKNQDPKAVMASFTARQRRGDVTRIANKTNYSVSHISNVLNGRRTVNETIAREMHRISYRRKANA
jgi:hypothetical protein